MKRGIFVAAACLLVAVACSNPYYFWLAPGATAAHMQFLHAFKPHGRNAGTLNWFEVETCEGFTPDLRKIRSQEMWRIERPYSDTVRHTGAITFGVVPVGYTARSSAVPLHAGCYQASGGLPGAQGSLYFWVHDDGRAVEFTRAERDSMFDTWEKHTEAELVADSVAILECQRAYASARADSVQRRKVDSMIPYDTMRFSTLDCATLRRVDSRLRDATAP